MMHAYIFPGQGAQFSGMGKNLFDENEKAKQIFKEADDILGFPISETMFSGTRDGSGSFTGRIFCAGGK